MESFILCTRLPAMHARYSSALVARGGSPQRVGRAGVSQISTNFFERLREAVLLVWEAPRADVPFRAPSFCGVGCVGHGLTGGTRAHPHLLVLYSCSMLLPQPAVDRVARAARALCSGHGKRARHCDVARRSQDPHALTRTSHELTLAQRTRKTKSTQEAHTYTRLGLLPVRARTL